MLRRARVPCSQCGADFRTAQGLAGHRRFRHVDREWAESTDRTQAQRLKALEAIAATPNLPPGVEFLIARMLRKYGSARSSPGPSDCLVCGVVCRTPQGLAGHMRHRHGAGWGRADRGTSAALVRWLNTGRPAEPIAEAVWEKVLRMEGFRW